MAMKTETQQVDYDVVIVGAGISGINFAYRLQERNPDLSFCILDMRHEIGGTWSFFRYPGVRSDDNLYSYGFAWYPWKKKEVIANGPSLLAYMKDAAAQYGLDKAIKFRHQVNEMHWSTPSKTWTLGVTVDGTASVTLRSRFVLLGTGYYDYDHALETDIPGLASFKGRVYHPQFWPSHVDFTGKNVVVIGSGSTATTLLPAIAKEAFHTTMLQRSPSYIVSIPNRSALHEFLKKFLPAYVAYQTVRTILMVTFFLFVSFCLRFPTASKLWIRHETKKLLPKNASLDPDFTPRYNPWEQRVSMSPDGEFYGCIRNGTGSVKTGVIETVTPNSIRLTSGEELYPHIIISATGLKLRFGGGIRVIVDDAEIDLTSRYLWKDALMEDIPNAVFGIGFSLSTWTLNVDITAQLACRLLGQMRERGATMIVPRRSDRDKKEMKQVPFFNLSSTYVRRASKALLKVGDRYPWTPRSVYWKDLLDAKRGNIEKGLEWS